MKTIKNIFLSAFSIIICLCMCSSFISPVAAAENIIRETEKANQILIKFDEIQNDITNSLVVEGDHYVYDVNYINNLFNDFDIKEFNAVTGKEYTLETLKNDIFNALDTYTVSNQISTYGTYYNRNAVEEGWNYWRWYMSEAKSNEMIAELSKGLTGDAAISGMWTILGALPGAQILWAAGFATWWKTTWNSLYCRSLQNVNGPGGTVTDINKFTSFYDCVRQVDFYA